MPNVKIGRYDSPSVSGEWTGWVEPDDASWIIFLGADGRPGLYWPQRDADGGVLGDPVVLSDSTETAGYR